MFVRNGELADVEEHQPDASSPPENEDHLDGERPAGVPWSELESIFGQDVHSLSLETVVMEIDRGSYDGMKWNEENINKLVVLVAPPLQKRMLS